MADIGKTAVILFNLGGPDKLESVEPFLYNFFKDPAILNLPFFLRYPLAFYIAKTRSRESRKNYAKMGGKTALIEETENQRKELQKQLRKKYDKIDVYVIMRYWFPRAKQVIEKLDTDYENILLLPLYPQYSSTTTGSSFREWKKYYKGKACIRAVCCYPDQIDFLESHRSHIIQKWKESGKPGNLRLLFSAHGLPENVIRRGDPYQYQIEKTAKEITKGLPKELSDWLVCYQSKVGPLEWTKPSLDDALKNVAQDGKDVLISPIAFVSEHLETLVELDDEYAKIASDLGINSYLRVPALSLSEMYLLALQKLVTQMLDSNNRYPNFSRRRFCLKDRKMCPNKNFDKEMME